MKILVFEYASTLNNTSLLSEGFNMLKAVLSDLSKLSYFNTYYLASYCLDDINIDNIHRITLEGNLYKWLEDNCSDYDYCLFIAPEDEYIQYNITRILEKNNVRLFNVNSKTSYRYSSKYFTYNTLQEDILKIPTIKCKVNNIDIEYIEAKLKNKNIIIKPDNRTSSTLVYKISNTKQLMQALQMYKKEEINEILIQDYIDGKPISVSAICSKEKYNILSINTQEIEYNENKIRYYGCTVLIKHKLENKILKITRKILENDTNLKGFIGIDYIISDDNIYFVELNPRITTPYIVLQKQAKSNLTENMIKLILDDKIEKIEFKSSDRFIVGE